MSFKLILISAENDLTNEISLLIDLFKSGLKIFHLRKPNHSKKELQIYLEKIPAQYRKRIVLHQHYALCLKYKLKGIHITEKNKKKSAALFANYKVISASYHSFQELEKNKFKFRYVFISPVFDSISKNEYLKKASLLKEMKEFKGKEKVIALGGVDAKKINRIKNTGFSGAAVLGFIWNAKNPIQRFQQLQKSIEE